MFKLIGIIGLIMSMGMMGVFKFTRLKRRKELLDDFLKLVMELRSQINYFKEPLPDLFLKISQNNESAAFLLVKEVGYEINEKKLQIAEIWPLKVKKIYEKEHLTDIDMELLKYVGSFIGQTDYNNHLTHFQYLEEHLKIQMDEAEEDIRRRGPLLKKMGFLVGIMISLVLL